MTMLAARAVYLALIAAKSNQDYLKRIQSIICGASYL
jgi:hypothetical protein